MVTATYPREKRRGDVTTWVDVIRHIENTLGWAPSWHDPRPTYKIRTVEAGKIKRVATARGYTVQDMVDAVEYMRARRQEAKTPMHVLYAVEDARKERRRTVAPRVLEASRDEVLAEVMAMPEGEERERWLRRLTRAGGKVLADLIEEWRSR